MKLLKSAALLLFAGLLFACGAKEEKTDTVQEKKVIPLGKLNLDNLLAEIKKREEAIREDTIKMDKLKAKELMDAYAAFQEKFNNRDKSAEYLFKAGELAMGLNLTALSIKYLDKVYNEYPKYEKRPYALFLKAFVLENQANSYDEARKNYELFIQQYPGHEMADDAEYSIKNMGKSPEELIREFEIQDSLKKARGEA